MLLGSSGRRRDWMITEDHDSLGARMGPGRLSADHGIGARATRGADWTDVGLWGVPGRKHPVRCYAESRGALLPPPVQALMQTFACTSSSIRAPLVCLVS